MATTNDKPKALKRTLGPLMLWGLGVGYVISGMYFGWNLGLAEGGTLGLAVATFFIIIMYLTFTFSYTELACAIPRAGGAFTYAQRGLGKDLGFLGGMAQNIEFIFAPPAIAFAIGAYLKTFVPANLGESVNTFFQNLLPFVSTDFDFLIVLIAVIAYLIFTGLNILGVRIAASFELVITIIAVAELLIFAGAALPHFEFSNLQKNALPNGWSGAFAAIPFAIWFFLAIEGVANVAEETINPQRNILIGFGSAILTLVVLCLITFASSVGIDGWEAIVYETADRTVTSDSPLPLAMAKAVGTNHFLFTLVTSVGLFGLVASFHGIILAGGRATFEFGREGYAPKFLGVVHENYQTPAKALLFNMFIGIIALFTGKTGEIITIACFGALTLYIVSMIAQLVLRKKEPDLERPFKVPFYPFTPIIALTIATVAFIAMTYYNLQLAMIYFGLLAVSYAWFKFTNND